VLRVVTGGGSDTAAGYESNPLLAALAPVGQYQGIRFRLPRSAAGNRGDSGDAAGSASDVSQSGRVNAAAEASQVQVRQVALKGDWWRTDNGPLLASHRETRLWLALLPARGGGYALFDAATDTTRQVDESVAAELGDFAYCFYRPLPASAVNAIALLRFGWHGQGHDLAMVAGLSLLTGVLGMMVPFVTGKLIDTLIPSAERDSVWMVTGALLAAALAAMMFGVARAIAVLRVEGKMDASLQAALWDRLLKLPVPFFRDYSAGDLALRLNGINAMRHALAGGTIGTLLSSVFASVNFLLLFYYSARLALAALGITVVAVVVIGTCAAVRLYFEQQMAPVAGRLSGMVFQYLSGITKLRVASAETRAFANWVHEFTWLRRLSFSAAQASTVQETFFSACGLAAAAVIFASTGMLLTEQAALASAAGAAASVPMTTGDFAGFMAAFGSFFAGMLALAAVLMSLLNLVPVYARLRPVLDALPEVDDTKQHPGQLAGGIEVVKAGFHYRDGPAILKSVSFSIRPGGFIALVGASGSGKSTLLRLLLGFEKPTAGSIYYDNQDLADLDVHAIRRQIGVVLQGGQLMSGDIFSNIVGASGLGIDDAWDAARLCGLKEDIENMPMGMHTVVSEGSSTLSGGQRQRILIARAVVHKPRIIFFDEATSALDNRTQAIVSHSLNSLKATRVVIAHRLSTIVHADRIIVLKDGEVAQNGSYQQLVGEPGPFAELVKRQMA
jgi:ATP-binding cassette subfamily C protein